MKFRLSRTCFAFFCFFLSSLITMRPAHAGNTVIVTTTSVSGPGSLSESIEYANNHPGITIQFALSANDPGRAADGSYQLSALDKSVSAPTVINGRTQTARADSNPDGPEIRIRDLAGISAAVTMSGVDLTWGGTVTAEGSLSLQIQSSMTIDGSTANIGGKLTIAAGCQLSIPSGATLTVPGLLTNAGTVAQQASRLYLGGPDASHGLVTNAGIWNLTERAYIGSVNRGGAPVFALFANQGTFTSTNSHGTGNPYDMNFMSCPFNNSGTVNCTVGGLWILASGIQKGLLNASSPTPPASPHLAPEIVLGSAPFPGSLGSGSIGPRLQLGAHFKGHVSILSATLENNVLVEDSTFITGGLTALPSAHFTGPGTVRWIGGPLTGTLNLQAGPNTPKFQWEGGDLQGTLNVPAGGTLTLLRFDPTAESYLQETPLSISTGVLNNGGTVYMSNASMDPNFIPNGLSNDVIRLVLKPDPAGSTKTLLDNSGRWIVNGKGTITDVLDNKASTVVHCGGTLLNTGTIEQAEKTGTTSADSVRIECILDNRGILYSRGSSIDVYTGTNTGTLRTDKIGWINLDQIEPKRLLHLSTGTKIIGDGVSAFMDGTVDGTIDVSGTLDLYSSSPGFTTYAPTAHFKGGGTVQHVQGTAVGAIDLVAGNSPSLQLCNGRIDAIRAPAGAVTSVRPFVDGGYPDGPDRSALVTVGDFRNAGAVVIDSRGTLVLSKADGQKATYLQTAGTIQLDGALKGDIDIEGGNLSGTGRIAAPTAGAGGPPSVLTNSGTISPGPIGGGIGTLTVEGAYIQTAKGKLLIDINGIASNQIDQLAITGTATLDGTIIPRATKVSLGGTNTTDFRVMDFASATGNFANIATPFTAVINPDHALLHVVPNLLSATVETPSTHSTVAALPSISGRALGASRGSVSGRIDLYIQRTVTPVQYWTGAAWSTTLTPLPTTFSLDGTAWSNTGALPAGADLADGSYTLIAKPYNYDGRNGVTGVSTITIRANAPKAAPIATKSPVVLSSATAQTDGSIQLTFTGALNASARSPINYSLSPDGVTEGATLEIVSVQQPAPSTVQLTVEGLSRGARIEVAYDLQDTAGRSIRGAAGITVK